MHWMYIAGKSQELLLMAQVSMTCSYNELSNIICVHIESFFYWKNILCSCCRYRVLYLQIKSQTSYNYVCVYWGSRPRIFNWFTYMCIGRRVGIQCSISNLASPEVWPLQGCTLHAYPTIHPSILYSRFFPSIFTFVVGQFDRYARSEKKLVSTSSMR